MKIIVREFKESDKPFIFSTWRKSAFYGVPHGTRPPADKFFGQKTMEIGTILARNARVRIACLEDDPQTIIGYSVSTGTHLQWIYVKTDFRKQGIGWMLFPKDTETVTSNLTKIGAAIVHLKNLSVPKLESGLKEEKGEKKNGSNRRTSPSPRKEKEA